MIYYEGGGGEMSHDSWRGKRCRGCKGGKGMIAYSLIMRKRPYQNLIAWQEAHQLCVQIYKVTSTFPSEERFGLVSQMRRSASSVPTNIAEATGRRSLKEKRQFLDYATGSLEELHYQVLLAFDLKYLNQKKYEELDSRIQKVGYLINQYYKSLIK